MKLRFAFFYKRTAGLITMWSERANWTLHLFPKRAHWVFGHVEDWYDGPIDHYGFGPLFLFVTFE